MVCAGPRDKQTNRISGRLRARVRDFARCQRACCQQICWRCRLKPIRSRLDHPAIATYIIVSFLGETAQILIETPAPHPAGRAERYFMIELPDSPHPPAVNDLVTARIEKNAADGVIVSLTT